MGYEPLHQKYRPQTFAQLVGQNAIATTLSSALRQSRIAPAYLFCGPRGTGKTSSARILAKSLNCLNHPGPSPDPCGQCSVCQSIIRGASLDVIEIDAASNTGVDNIRDLIERTQFAPVECRYKVYVIDECLTGDTQVVTNSGKFRIDNPELVGKKALSYNESLDQWEFKPIVRHLDQGERQTYIIDTGRVKIKCTGNHLIRTEAGWLAASTVKEGMRILSPANADAVQTSLDSALMGGFVDLSAATSSREISLDKKLTALTISSHQRNLTALYAPVDVANDLKYPALCSRRAMGSGEFSLAGKSTLTSQNMEFGPSEPKPTLLALKTYPLTAWDSYTELCLETAVSTIPTSTVDSQGYLGRTEKLSRHGWNTKQLACRNYAPILESNLIKDMGIRRLSVVQPAILSLLKFFKPLNQTLRKSRSLLPGWIASRLREWPGGIWMMAPFESLQQGVHKFKYTPKDFLGKKTNSSAIGSQDWDIQPEQESILELKLEEFTSLLPWGQTPLENSCQTSNHSLSQQWHTSLETVKSVRLGEVERVYDIEVEDNHNFVANGLLVHNCHMLSTAAFNALLKTLEEPPERVVFVLATTDPQRVLPTIISRCQRFDFRRIPLADMTAHLSAIAAQEQIQIEPAAVQLVAQIAQGGLRDAESLLDQLSLLDETITSEHIWELVGAVPERDLLALAQAIAADDSIATLDQARHLIDRGREPLIVLQSLAGFYRDLAIAKTARARADLVAITPPTWAAMGEFVQALPLPQLLHGQQHLRAAEAQVKNASQPRLWLEIALMGLLPSGLNASASAPAAPIPTAKPAPQLPQPKTIATPAPSQSSEPRSDQSSEPPSASANSPAKPEDKPPKDKPPEAPHQATPPPAEPPPEVSPAASSLSDIWLKILASVQPPGTRMLMSQQGQLLGFDGVGARVGFRSQPLLKLAQERIPNVEAAFEQVFKRKIRVLLEVTKPEDPPEAPSGPSNVPPKRPPPAPPTGAQPPKTVRPAPLEAPPEAPPKASPEASPAPPTSPTPPQPEPEEPQPPTWKADSDFDQNVRRFANFFNGQIVNLDDDNPDEPPQPDGDSEDDNPNRSSEPGPDVPF